MLHILTCNTKLLHAISNDLCVHPSIHYLHLWTGCGGSKLSRVFRTFLSPAPHRETQGVPRQDPHGIYIQSREFWVRFGVSSRKTFKCRRPNQLSKSPQLAPFDMEEQWGQLYSELSPDDWAHHPISDAEPSHPHEEPDGSWSSEHRLTFKSATTKDLVHDERYICLSISHSIPRSLRYLTPTQWIPTWAWWRSLCVPVTLGPELFAKPGWSQP